MRLLLLILVTLGALGVLAQETCNESERYRQRVDLDHNQALFVEPGLYTEGRDYLTFCHGGVTGNRRICEHGALNTCKYLGFTDVVSWGIEYKLDSEHYVSFGRGHDAPRFFTDNIAWFISDIVCK